MFEINPTTKYILTVVGDYNDADELANRTECTGEQILSFLPLIEEIYKQSGHKMPDGTHHNFDIDKKEEMISFYVSKGISNEIIKDFISLCPYDYDGDMGIHTLWKVYVEEIVVVPRKELFYIRNKYHWNNGVVVRRKKEISNGT